MLKGVAHGQMRNEKASHAASSRCVRSLASRAHTLRCALTRCVARSHAAPRAHMDSLKRSTVPMNA